MFYATPTCWRSIPTWVPPGKTDGVDFSGWPALVVVDVEGNGGSPADLVEVALLPVRGGRPDLRTGRAWLVRPPRPVTPFAARVHGLTDDTLAGCPAWQDIADQVRSTLGQAWIAAHNAHVDYRALSAHLPGWQPAGVVDTLRLARAGLPGLPSYTLDALIGHFEPDLSGAADHRHRARYDAHATALVLLALAERYLTWSRLAEVGVPPGLPGGRAGLW
ncbi:3'-5' exonuclease [Actinacidiphila bryophytorum]|uniref:3'-5' exonuclease n=1 Tax=Actinacidiphila bryophytorum TaxID=1436133 RepID=UPI002AFE44E8|nr:3'-5' exonuclease [Actinacidiphila bryophytorum]